jgi:hypothetical protein
LLGIAPGVGASTERQADAGVTRSCAAARYLLANQTRLMNQAKGLSFLPQNDSVPVLTYLTKATNDACAGRFSAGTCQRTGVPIGAFPQYAIVMTDWYDARSFAHAANEPLWEARFSNEMWTEIWDAATRIVPHISALV